MNPSSRPLDRNGQVPPELAGLGATVRGDEPRSAVLRRVAELATQVIPELTAASVTLIDDSHPRTVVSTDPLAVRLDEGQYAEGFGPCTDAAATGSTIQVDTARTSEAYPGFARLSATSGVTHVLSVGLPVPQRVVGALNLYSTAPAGFSDDSVALAETFAAYAAIGVTNLALYAGAAERAQQLESALRTRAMIEQAKGIVMARRHCTPDEASAVLHRLAVSRDEGLPELAAQLVERTQTRAALV